MSIFLEMRLVGVTLLHADRQAEEETDRQTEEETDRQTEGLMYTTKLTGAFRNYTNACTNYLMFCSEITPLLNIV